ncbi:PP2C family protein-serine/threonine phosphatase [Microbulbifer hydrolyticus]|uniref:Serine phosphatase RsbU (Regulator of sigma subunit) n=1 Tax=Microbulbifer hydrolyticus TaxID=48074 RepID=A0A6P1TEA6_9GAMM|nr:SpoIIE family protein phosphatase [Microbulbifer hydrolyticus]MBB5212329.1 serine phosphatase RsbU (regulator of sigma subunit) [Microbulbifer hydrolyticus]QHQ39976.1 SpoIIE family protein phosphatase [Microbulbifer hydrolyticus]
MSAPTHDCTSDPSPSTGTSQPDRERHTLLLIDPDSPPCKLVQSALERLGYAVTVRDNGVQAIGEFTSEEYQLVVTDLHLPDMGGLEVLRKVKHLSPDTPVMVLASDSEVDDVVQALRLGASDYLLKPIADEGVIDHAVTRIMEARDLAAENRKYREQLESRNRELNEHIELLQRDHEAGRQLQQHLLPRTPYEYPAGIKAEYRLLPSLYLSGDFIDYGLFGERFVAFYLVDVSGHGVSSALVTALIKHSIMHLLRERPLFSQLNTLDQDLTEILEMINRELLSTRLDKHASMFVGVVDSRARQLHYAVAGQVPMPVLVTSDGAEWLGGKGRPLGLFQHGGWEVRHCSLPASWRLVACSDGVLELLPGDLLQKEECLLQTIDRSRGDLGSLCAALKVDTAESFPDDITILTLRQDER